MANMMHVSFLVKDYNEAIDYFRSKLDFELIEDTKINSEKRWVLVSPKKGYFSLLLAKAVGDQINSVGNQAGGRVFLFLQTENFSKDFDEMKKKGVNFIETPRKEAFGTVAVFKDLYGNKWDLIENKK